VARLVDGVQPYGESQIVWQGVDARGQPVASGLYFARLEADGFVQTQKLVLMR
jgi:hypothetical protein